MTTFSKLASITGIKAIETRTYVFSYKPFVDEYTKDEQDFDNSFNTNERNFIMKKMNEFVKENIEFNYFNVSINEIPSTDYKEIKNQFGYHIYLSVNEDMETEFVNEGWL